MNAMNPVVFIMAFVIALVGGGGGATIFSALINRKAQAAMRTNTLEEASASFRQEVRRENVDLKREIADMKKAFITLTDLLDDLLPGMVESLSPEDKLRLRDAVNKAKIVT
jgi:hypothetical protein